MSSNAMTVAGFEGSRMEGVPSETQQDSIIAEAVKREAPRLRDFIRRRVLNTSDAEDILQDVFYELIAAYRLMKPAEQMTSWLFRVARNRVTDVFRRRAVESLSQPVDGELVLEDLLPSAVAGPDALYARGVLMDAIDEALEELPEEQRLVFLAHEVEGRSFKDMAEESGTSINTLLARKRYAVLHLRSRLRELYGEVER